MPMTELQSMIFIDGGEPEETRQANDMIMKHFGRPLDGQTTNPTLIAKNLTARLEGAKITQKQGIEEYQRIVGDISRIIPAGSISIQVFADLHTNAEEMLKQARLRIHWIANASIKFPATTEGLKAASQACHEMPINITLVFSQAQAAAVYEATRGAKFPVFISPFVGRLDDLGENGMDVIVAILKMYRFYDHHVQVLTASVRNLDHLLYALHLKSDIITIPFKVFKLWADAGFILPPADYEYPAGHLTQIPYRADLNPGLPWQKYDLAHDLTKKGVDSFYSDWNKLFQ